MLSKKLGFAVLLAMCGQAFAGPVNVNRADAASLAKELNGVGKVTAARIVEARKTGEFKDLSDLKLRVDGVGDKIIAKNQDNIRFKD